MGKLAKDFKAMFPQEDAEDSMEEILKKIREALGIETDEEILASVGALKIAAAEKLQASEDAEQKLAAAKAELETAKEENVALKAAQEQELKAAQEEVDALKKTIDEMGATILLAKREDELGRKLEDDERDIVVSMSDAQFGLYVKAAKVVSVKAARKKFSEEDDGPKTSITL